MKVEKIELSFLRMGDMQKVADQLKVEYQKVRDVSGGRVKDDLIATTLILLNEEREREIEIKSKSAVENIVTY